MSVNPLTWWQEAIGEIVPAGHALRFHLRARWVRFHSLPESKRYAESEAEYSELLRRHTAVTGALFTTGEPIFVYQSRLEHGDEFEEGEREIVEAPLELGSSLVKLRANPGTVAAEDDDHYAVRALVTEWKPAFFNDLARQIADDVEHAVTFVAPNSKNIYCPYDGGMDVFVFSMTQETLIAQFSAWQSSRDDKL